MADRHLDDLNLDMSGDSERLVISVTPFTPLNADDADIQQPDDITHDVADSHHHEPTILKVEVYHNDSDVDDDDQVSTRQQTEHDDIPDVQSDGHDTSSLTTPRQFRPAPSFLVENILPSDQESSQTLPGIAAMMARSSDVTSVFQPRDSFPSQHVPLSFWDTPDYNYVLDTDYSSDSSQRQPALSWTSCDVSSGRTNLQFPFIQPPRDTAPPPVIDSGHRLQHQDSDTSTASTTATAHAMKVSSRPKTVQRAITTRQNPLAETKPYQRHPKPPYSYAAMSIMAIENSPNKSLMYREITDAIHDMFPAHFGGEYQGWRKSVRHMLSRMKCFTYEKKYDELTNRSCYYWQVDLTQVKPEWFLRQLTKEDTRKTEHEFMPYLHQQLNVPPVILPEQHCDSDTVSTPSAVSRAMRNVLLQQQQVDATKKVSDYTAFQLPAPEPKTTSSDFGVTLPSKPANFKLSSMASLAADPDDFLGAKINTTYDTETDVIQRSVSTADNIVEEPSVPDVTLCVEEPVKNLGLPTYIFDSPIASPIPHDVYRDTEGSDRHCPSVGLSPSTETSASSKSQSKKRARAAIRAKPNKKAKTSAGKKQPTPSTTFDVTSGVPSTASGFQFILPSQTTTPMFYPTTEPAYQPFVSTASPYLPPFSFDNDKPLCWPPVDNVNAVPFQPGSVVPSLPFGYSSEQFPWYRQPGYPHQTPASYGYPTYDTQYGFPSGYGGYQQYQNEASRWYQVPYDGALNLSTKPDF